MKKLAVIAGVLAIFGASASTADARGYTCTYRIPGAGVMSIDGYDNEPSFCRSIKNDLGGVRIASSRLPVVCVWKMRSFDVFVTIRHRSRTTGKLLCMFLADGLNVSDWQRLR